MNKIIRNNSLCNATNIKLLAVVLMFIDHIHQMFWNMGVPEWLDLFGRPVFPLFLFLAADSFHYTHDRKKYMRRLLVASWCMVVLTNLTERIVPNPDVVLMNNAFNTFFVTTIYMLAWDTLCEGRKTKNKKQIGKAVVLALVPVILSLPIFILAMVHLSTTAIQIGAFVCLLLPSLLIVEGGPLYVLLGLLLYIFREKRLVQIAIVLAYAVVYYLLSGGVQWAIALAAIPMLFYNGQKGRGMKNFFYLFYPIHIIGLYLLATLVF
jgi:hypothetical protein